MNVRDGHCIIASSMSRTSLPGAGHHTLSAGVSSVLGGHYADLEERRAESCCNVQLVEQRPIVPRQESAVWSSRGSKQPCWQGIRDVLQDGGVWV